MERRRGLIVERSGRRITALTRSGEFVTFRSPREDFLLGMEIAIPGQRFAVAAWRRFAPALALSVVLLVTSFFGYRQYLYAQPLMAYVTLDYAGSVELEVNRAGLVKSATALDDAGAEALSHVDYRMRPAEEVVEALVKSQDLARGAAPRTHAGGGPDVIVAVVPVKAGHEADDLEKKVTANKVTSFRLDMETRESAKELGISAGRAAMWALSKGQALGQQGRGETPTDRESILDAIKGTLPQLDLSELEKQKDAGEREKYVKEVTKGWVDRVVEEVRKEKDTKEVPPSTDATKGQPQAPGSGQGSGQGSGKGRDSGHKQSSGHEADQGHRQPQ